MTTAPTALDYLAYLNQSAISYLDAAAESVSDTYDTHCDARWREKRIDAALELIDCARTEIADAAAALGIHGTAATFSDGRPVTAACDIEDGSYFVHTAHPDPGHHINQPRQVCTVDRRDGTRVRIVLHTDGSVEAVAVEPLRAV